MRKRTVRMILTAVTVVALLLGIPGAFAASVFQWHSEQRALDTRVTSLVRALERRIQLGHEITETTIEAWTLPSKEDPMSAWTRVVLPKGQVITAGTPHTGLRLTSSTVSSTHIRVRMDVSAYPAIEKIFYVCLLFLGGVVFSLIVGWIMANRFSRKLSAPLIYLSAQAEQIGSGHVRARVKPSGIEEIDLVQEELVRTGERMAGRLAAERQFAADASHQLRTPLTALSMRLEEIELITTQDEVREEVHSCLEQVERLTGVLTDLLDANARGGGRTEAIHILEVFNTQREEWENTFENAGRSLVFTDEAECPLLADNAKLGQVLATLIENSLNYGEGITRVIARRSSNKRGVVIDVSDEGQGIDPDFSAEIFEYGISGHGSTGIGLALAKDLTNAMGGRLELAQAQPPIFRLSLAAVPASLDPNRVMPVGPLVSMGRRSRRF
ncbi:MULTISPECIES: HAMP domain-containing sensor histidine kinase [unclassified Schaalia]|uniref:HAMP domain-containing sensor histidine kinase n=1 Tax=unclassified Schaalia TaxID=2691889 RepID=UPI001E3A87C4|nr:MULTISPECIES: HAMP domain-containing sensor histidine kinase [unclassified Schaalia]MCD4549752.1 HAMP domain-containing histidine kinase [Schaalia sp. lx-260]MCD4556768.1 HAMP domain-containing histidine kinase [Schaalia sp. lx-100]